MHRRLLTILLSVTGLFALSAAASGCSSFSDADASARVNDTELSPEQLTSYVEALGQGEVTDGDTVRNTLNIWVLVEVAAAGLDEAGTPVSDDLLAQARTTLDAQLAGFADLPADTADELVRWQATLGTIDTLPDPQGFVTASTEAADIFIDPRLGTFDPVVGVLPLGGPATGAVE